MTTTIRQSEEIPASYPATPSGLSTAAAALEPAMVWHRLESWIAHRFSERAVVWTVEGLGCWEPPLTPATITKCEIWRGEAWEELTLPAAPLGGFVLGGCGPYRFTGTVGVANADVPAGVSEAYRRLAEYMAAKPGKPGAVSESVSAGSVSISTRRSPSWIAQAMQNSGAADLLRSYRRAS